MLIMNNAILYTHPVKRIDITLCSYYIKIKFLKNQVETNNDWMANGQGILHIKTAIGAYCHKLVTKATV